MDQYILGFLVGGICQNGHEVGKPQPAEVVPQVGTAKLVCNQLGRFHKWGIPKNGWFIRETPIKTDDLGVPPFMESSISSYLLQRALSIKKHDWGFILLRHPLALDSCKISQTIVTLREFAEYDCVYFITSFLMNQS